MSKKYDIKRLLRLRRSQMDMVDCHYSFEGNFHHYPVDWSEFKEILATRRHVMVEFPQDKPHGAMLMLSMYSAIKLSQGTSIGVCNFFGRSGFPQVNKLASMVCKDKDIDLLDMGFYYDVLPSNFSLHDEWILNASFREVVRGGEKSSDGSEILNALVQTNGFSEPQKDAYGFKVLVGWEDTLPKRRKKVVMAWDVRGRKALADVIKAFPDRFLAIRYTKEKRMVDEWFAKNETMVDPGFDIQLMDPALDQRKVLLYAATNRLYDFRKFAKVLPEVVERYLGKKELKELL